MLGTRTYHRPVKVGHQSFHYTARNLDAETAFTMAGLHALTGRTSKLLIRSNLQGAEVVEPADTSSTTAILDLPRNLPENEANTLQF
jgi:hypothetical protein